MARSACSVDQFSSLIRKLSGCSLKTDWIAKYVALPALDVCLLSFSSSAAALRLQQYWVWIVWCLMFFVFFLVSHLLLFMHDDDLGQTNCLDTNMWKFSCLTVISRSMNTIAECPLCMTLYQVCANGMLLIPHEVFHKSKWLYRPRIFLFCCSFFFFLETKGTLTHSVWRLEEEA